MGKTTTVGMLAQEFDHFVPMNLELPADRSVFTSSGSAKEAWEAIRFLKEVQPQASARTLLFLDEIQKCPEAVAMLRYFHEELPELHVIAAGSLLESMLDLHASFPVGRVEFLLMHPLSFEEFLMAAGEETVLKAYRTVPVPAYAHEKLEQWFRKYLLIGGMPEAVSAYLESGDLSAPDRVHESLVIAYLEDVEKYGTRAQQIPILRHVIQSAFLEAAGRIRYEGFGNSNYKSRDIKEAFTILGKAFLFQTVHPVTSTLLPLMPDTKKSPRLHALDTGLVVFRTGMRKTLFAADDISSVYSGRILEHAVGQELYATSASPLHALHFWARDKTQSNAEVDYVVPWRDKVIPIEVKTGAAGRLRSLHAFLDAAPHPIGVRLYGGAYRVETAKTLAGKEYTLINVPWFHAALVERYLEQLP